MNILGIYNGYKTKSVGHHNGAVLISGDKIIGISSERLDRIKRSCGYYIKEKGKKKIAYSFDSCHTAINYCLNDFNIKKIDILVYSDGDEEYLKNKYKPEKIVNIESHHLAHCCSSYFCSPFKDAAVITIDGCGSVEGTDHEDLGLQSIYNCKNNSVKLIKTTLKNEKRKISIGLMYQFITYNLLGISSEGTTMGLSSYGKYNPKFDFFDFFINYDGNIYINDKFLEGFKGGEKESLSRESLLDFFGYTEEDVQQMKEDITNSELADIAYKLQKEVEQNMIYLANEAYKLTGSKNLCIAGGVGLNCIANKLILDKTHFENIFISPPTDDSGIALGSALYGKNIVNNDNNRFILQNAFFGKKYKNEEIQINFEKYSDYLKEIKKEENIYKVSAKLISEGKVLGWFHGGSEMGPRALGHRSIVGDSRKIEIRDKINNIKNREKRRPLAPIILEEYVQEYFDIDYPSRFMLLIANAKQKAVNECPGIVHFDKTARIQTVTKESSKEFYYLLKEFNKITKVPVLVNTSFNFAGEPIIETPEQAIKSFLASGLDYLIMNNYIISKDKIYSEFMYEIPLIQIHEKTIISGTSNLSQELELLKYFNDSDFYVSYSLSDKVSSEVDKGKFRNINFIDNPYRINNSGLYIFFEFIPKDNLNIYNHENKYVFIGNIKDTTENTNTVIKEIDHYSFSKSNNNKLIEDRFPKAKISTIGNINPPSSISSFIDKNNSASSKYIHDIVIVLGGGIDIKMIDSLLPKLKKYKILIIGLNDSSNDIKNKTILIKSWKNHGNIKIINKAYQKNLLLLLYTSKIALLPFKKEDYTETEIISDLLLLGKNILTSKIKQTQNIKNIVFCDCETDYLSQTKNILEEKIYNKDYEKIKEYYYKNFNLDIILDNISQKFKI